MEKKDPIITNETAAIQHPDYQQELVSLIRSGISPRVLRDKVSNYHENDIAAVLDILTKEERVRLYHILDAQTLSDVLEYTDNFGQYFSE